MSDSRKTSEIYRDIRTMLKGLAVIALLILCGLRYLSWAEYNYSVAQQHLQNGNVKTALARLEAISWKGRVKNSTLPIVRGIVYKDVEGTVKAIRSDACSGKCDHALIDWVGYMNNCIEVAQSPPRATSSYCLWRASGK